MELQLHFPVTALDNGLKMLVEMCDAFGNRMDEVIQKVSSVDAIGSEFVADGEALLLLANLFVIKSINPVEPGLLFILPLITGRHFVESLEDLGTENMHCSDRGWVESNPTLY